MSTILKALHKNNQTAPFETEKSSDKNWKWLLLTVLTAILILLAVVAFLLFKMPSASHDAIQPQVIVSDNVSDYLVSEVNFKTKPLPIKVIEKNEKKKASPQQDLTLDKVSTTLQQRFDNAVQFETDNENKVLSDTKNNRNVINSDISAMPASFQYLVPLMRYDSHMYSSNTQDSWIRINGVDLRVGDYVGEIELLEIQPNQSVFRLDQQHFTLSSLQDWKG